MVTKLTTKYTEDEVEIHGVLVPRLTMRLVDSNGTPQTREDVVRHFENLTATGIVVKVRYDHLIRADGTTRPLSGMITDISDQYVELDRGLALIPRGEFHEWYELD